MTLIVSGHGRLEARIPRGKTAGAQVRTFFTNATSIFRAGLQRANHRHRVRDAAVRSSCGRCSVAELVAARRLEA
jgi:hypothetical protein